MTSRLIGERRQPRLGFFDQPVGPVEPADFDLRSPMGDVLEAAERDAEFRQFQFLGAIADDIVVGCALTQSAYLQSGFAYVCRMSDRQLVQLRLPVRDGDELAFSRDPDHGTTELTSRGARVEMSADGPTKRLIVESDELQIDLSIDESGFETQRLCTRSGPTGFSYAQKVAGVTAQGSVTSALGRVDLADLDAGGHHDFTAGFLRPETWWHWACLSATTNDGRRVGLNVSCGTNETSYSENCFWVDGAIERVGGAVFDFDPDDWDRSWTIRSVDGTVDLRFRPAHGYHATGGREAVATNFHQLFGVFDGTMRTEQGDTIEIDGLPGFSESQYLRW
jgi:hypothetical protein